LTPPAADAEAVSATEQLGGIYPAGSRLPDKKALGGFGPCDNFPHDLGGKDWGDKGAVSVIAFRDEPCAYFKNRGIVLRVVNRTRKDMPFDASDSSLFLVAEAKDQQGEWRMIESMPRTFCGNSFHRVFLEPDQYWQFPAREYAGPVKTTLRYRLDRAEDAASIYSNEFEGRISATQFEPLRK